MSDDHGAGPIRAKRFGDYVATAARAAGYDIDSQRGGGRAALARDTGMSASSVGRMLKGERLPSPRFYERLAKALRVPLRQLLIESGNASDASLDYVAERLTPITSLTPEEAAPLLGITIPANVKLFVSMVENLLGQEQESTRDNTSSGAP
jgi:transcriptional regulator with XRE-family HTH domain